MHGLMHPLGSQVIGYALSIDEKAHGCKVFVLLAIENDFTDMLTGFHSRVGFSRFGQRHDAIDHRLYAGSKTWP